MIEDDIYLHLGRMAHIHYTINKTDPYSKNDAGKEGLAAMVDSITDGQYHVSEVPSLWTPDHKSGALVLENKKAGETIIIRTDIEPNTMGTASVYLAGYEILSDGSMFKVYYSPDVFQGKAAIKIKVSNKQQQRYIKRTYGISTPMRLRMKKLLQKVR